MIYTIVQSLIQNLTLIQLIIIKQIFLNIYPALKKKILLVPVNRSLQHQHSRSSYLPQRSQDCLLPLTKMSVHPNLACTQVETISDSNYLVGIPFER